MVMGVTGGDGWERESPLVGIGIGPGSQGG